MIFNTFLLAFREIRRNLLRSFLTILGIVIGVAAVISLVTIGNGATASVTEQIASLGNNMLIITSGKRMRGPDQSAAPAFDLSDAKALEKEVPSLAAVTATASASETVVNGSDNWSTTVTGTDNNFFTIRNWSIDTGRFFEDAEMQGGRSVCVIGATIRNELFGGQNPVGQSIRVKNFSCQIIGLLQSKGQSTMGSDQDDIVVMPLKTVQRRLTGNKDIKMMQVSVKDGYNTDTVISEIETIMRERRHLSYNEDNNFSVMDMKEITNMLTSTTKVLTALLGAVAAVSLLVGGIGIMNIMLVSVTERTREIGIRLAIGAMEKEVLLQFLVEAVVLSAMGGVIGIVLALTASVVLSKVIAVPFIFDSGIVMLSFLFSVAVGIIFGYFPALKAARLDPIEALRHE
ncbi:MAG: ABC transporter permease [Deferribacterales bacterium]